MSEVLFGLFGLSCLLAITWLFSNNKRAVDWKLVATGVVFQIVFATFVLRTESAAPYSKAWANYSLPSLTSPTKVRK